MTLVDKQVGVYTLSVDLMVNIDTSMIRVTGVYGPSNQRDKALFFEELKKARPQFAMPWMVAGDFNVTLDLQDRSNTNHHVNQMRAFRGLIEHLELIDLPLLGRRYTWSNERENPTFVRLDRFLVSTEWIQSFPNTVQTAGTDPLSDHCPLLCTSQTKFPTSNVFRLENSWLKLNQFKELVENTWA